MLNNYLDSAISKETNKGYKVDRVKLKTNMRKYLPTNSSFSEVYGEKLMGYDKLNGLIDGGLITDRNTLEVKKDISRMEALSHGQSACLSNDNQTKRLKNCRGEKCTDNGGDRDSQKKKALRM